MEHFGVRNEEVETLLKDIGRILKEAMPPGWGFALELFSYGDGGDLFYISSARREDIIKLLGEWKEKLEKAGM